MKYIDAEKLRAEIEREQRRLIVLSSTEQVDIRRDCALQNGVYTYILGLITSLQQEQPEVDLEKEIEKYFYDNFAFISSAHTPTKDIVSDIANHFYELGLNARK